MYFYYLLLVGTGSVDLFFILSEKYELVSYCTNLVDLVNEIALRARTTRLFREN